MIHGREALPLPDPEAWKYTPTAVLRRAWLPAPSGRVAETELPPPLPGFIRWVSVNGRFAIPSYEKIDPSAQLTRAILHDGTLSLALEPGASGDRIELVHVVTPGADGVATRPRVRVRLLAEAKLTLVETFVGPADVEYLAQPHVAVELGAGAHLIHLVNQDEGRRASHVGTMRVRLDARSRFDGFVVHRGAALARREVSLELEGPEARAELDALLLTRGLQHHDQHVEVRHAHADATSRQRVRMLVSDAGRAVYTGRVHVEPGAIGTDAAQSARALLLSREAEADLRPHLEIHADDVKAAHGATVGELDREQLFYLRSRGIPEGTARTLLMSAFAREIIDVLPVPVLRERVLANIEALG